MHFETICLGTRPIHIAPYDCSFGPRFNYSVYDTLSLGNDL